MSDDIILNFKDSILTLKEVEPTLKEMKNSKSAGKILLYPRRIYINKALEEISNGVLSELGKSFAPKYARFLIDDVQQWIAIKFEDEINAKNLPIHYSNTKRTYISVPVTIAEKTRPLLSKRKSGNPQPTYLQYFYHEGMILFPYQQEAKS